MYLVIRNITVRYGEKSPFIALDDVSLNINKGEFFTLLGPSGCGKTTLLRTIAGFVTPTSGTIRLDGQDILSVPPHQRPVNTVFQNYALFPHMSVSQNIGFGLEMQNLPKSKVKSIVADMLELVKMTPMASRMCGQISGGQQQRVALARALAPKPKVILLDEPLSALDFKLRKSMQLELKRLQHDTGITFIFVTHDQQEALVMSDRIAVMQGGRVHQVGTPNEIYDQPADRFVADFIGETNFLPVQVNKYNSNSAEVILASGKALTIPVDFTSATDQVLLALRPEHMFLCTPEQADITGVLQEVVYIGTDTDYHIHVTDQSQFVIRQSNRPGNKTEFSVGETIGIAIHQGGGRLLPSE